MNETLESQYNRFRNATKLWLSTVGVRPGKRHGFFLRLLPFLHMSVCILPIYGVFNTLKINTSNVLILARCISPLTGFLTTVVKVGCITYNRREICDMHVNLGNYFEKVLAKATTKKSVLNGVTAFRRIPIIVVIFTGVTCLLFTFTPIIFIIQQKMKNIEPIKYILPFPTIYPWKIPPASLLYTFHLLSQSATSLSIFYITASVDTFYAFELFQMIGLLQDVSYRLTHFGEKDDRGDVIRKCLIQYGVLLNFRNKLQKIYGPIILWTMGTNTILLCGLAFQLTQAKYASTARILLVFFHAGMKTIQIFLYNWAGNRLTEESESYRIALYFSNWYEDTNLMKTIMMALGQRPLIIKACSYLIVSLDTFGYVMNTTVSYFVFLRTVEQANIS